MIRPTEASRFGVDTGGTFTDVVMPGGDGRLRVYKLLSTPADPSEAIGDGVDALLGSDERPYEVVHGTTVATNALLERRGARVAFVITAGFEDVLWLGRQARPELYALHVKMPEPVVARADVVGVHERLSALGEVIEVLSETEIARVVADVEALDVDAVAICTLHAWANPAHEARLARAFRQHSAGWHVSVSHEISGAFREFERASTASVNAYVGPLMARYLRRLQGRLKGARGVEVLLSHGGRAEVAFAAEQPVHTVLSGPAGGVVGALQAAREVGLEKIITLDMGGTSTDVSLVDGELEVREDAEIDGLSMVVPVIDIVTVGAGGGSIAYRDAGGALRVGPRSAGASPGPACYGRGGQELTVTDAHLALGTLRSGRFLGGEMTLDAPAALRALGRLADALETPAEEVARGVLAIADAAMARALKVVSLERGRDPRDFTLVGFGGAGGLHACRLAEALSMRRVLIPQNPGLLSARGMLGARRRRYYRRTVLRPLTEVLAEDGSLRELLRESELSAVDALGAESGAELELRWEVGLRYQGQSFEVVVPVDWSAELEGLRDPSERFEAEHERLYGYRAAREVELVGLRLSASLSDAPALDALAPEGDARALADAEEVMLDMGKGAVAARVIERAWLAEGQRIKGPVILTEYSATTVVLPGWEVVVSRGHLILERES
ncbi:hydantoinase/oxoprolinase family protein [Lujinxingia sediminis]|uniref:Hydantoinase/oxoprolinase family protein n=1 Tax=Lujinxingia sediminis TaxID=2480984 RepID=A0ABY0CTH1_9DELT|nr:hydantoinase/oxoprolinase family protein [Lujinxingia sediminis]RVU44752.1 hydantoinase/oxoprolinase family protein [Lujinxingia sediminis]